MKITKKDIAIVSAMVVTIPLAIGFGAIAAVGDTPQDMPPIATPAEVAMTPSEILKECDARSAWGVHGAGMSRDDWRRPKSLKYDRSELMDIAYARGGRHAVGAFNLGWGYAREGHSDTQIKALIIAECFDDFGVNETTINGAK